MCVRGSRIKILECAKERFHQAGYQATSVDDILSRTGVARSNFYYHFRSKEDLADAVLEMQTAEYARVLQGSLHNADLEPSQRLEHFCRQICLIQTVSRRSDGCPFGNFAATIAADDGGMERFRVRLCSAFRQIEAAFQACIQEGVACGQFRSDVPAPEMARFALATLEGLMILAKAHRTPELLEGGLKVLRQFLESSRSDRQN
jgi:TetR/AcrR family transcriptional repressor of nem operon